MNTIGNKTGDNMPPPWHGQELARREALYQAGKVPVYDWSEVKARLDNRYGPERIAAHFGPIWVTGMPSES